MKQTCSDQDILRMGGYGVDSLGTPHPTDGPQENLLLDYIPRGDFVRFVADPGLSEQGVPLAR